jgi:hypothetical protein
MAHFRVTRFCIVAAVTLLYPVGAFATCQASLQFGGAPPLITLTGTTSGNCVPENVRPGMAFFQGERQLGPWHDCPPGQASCSITIDFETFPLKTGSYPFWVSTGCGNTPRNRSEAENRRKPSPGTIRRGIPKGPPKQPRRGRTRG